MTLNRYTIAPISALVCIAGAALVLAGPLDPPAGTIAPTYKTLSDVEPRIAISQATTPGTDQALFRITQPGSYYLTSNIRVDSITYGIEIAASAVTIDLNGFMMFGGAEPGSSGIYSSQNQLRDISLRNGEFSNFEDSAINLATLPVVGGSIENVKCRSNRGHGIWVGNSFRITGCSSIGNNGDGFRAGRNTTMSECTATGNLGDNGFSLDAGSVATSCVATTNYHVGFFVGHAGTLNDCNSFGNAVSGIVTQGNAVLTACNSFGNREIGISAGIGTSISGCSVRSNNGIGIDADAECSISACTVGDNGGHGISLVSDSVATGNTCTRNGTIAATGAGIYVNGAACRIDSNHVAGNDYGIRSAVADTLVVRNTARANALANYSFAVPTESAQIINNPGANFVATNPWANFSY